MLQRANDDLKTHTEKHQDEMEEWKTTCDRLSSNLGRKDSQVTELNDRFNEAHKQVINKDLLKDCKLRLNSSHRSKFPQLIYS